MSLRCHVIGGGLAGLAAAVELAQGGAAVTLYEAGPRAGGRCRSYFDSELGCRIDNGNHLLLSGNRDAMAYLETIGAGDSLVGPSRPEFLFRDLRDGAQWTIRPDRWLWFLDPSARVPGTSAADYLPALALAWASADLTVAGALGRRRAVHEKLWQPFSVAVLNTECEAASARLLWRVLRETFGRGPAACCPLVPRIGLSESLVDPALDLLRRRGAEVRLGARVRRLEFADDRVGALDLGGERIDASRDMVVLAVPPAVASGLVPGLEVPDEYRAILNAHYRWHPGPDAPAIVGLVGGTAEWVFAKREVVSVTVSAADRLMDRPAEALAEEIWREVAAVHGAPTAPMPAWRIVKERRATFAATPSQLRRRPRCVTAWQNLALAGDWTRTDLPATIEGAIKSGRRAAAIILNGGKS